MGKLILHCGGAGRPKTGESGRGGLGEGAEPSDEGRRYEHTDGSETIFGEVVREKKFLAGKKFSKKIAFLLLGKNKKCRNNRDNKIFCICLSVCPSVFPCVRMSTTYRYLVSR